MSRTQRGGEQGQYPLEKQFQLLEQDWNSYKESIPRCRRRRPRSLSPFSNARDSEFLGLGLLDNSPKKLLSSLQQCHSPPPQRRSKVFKGRSLLEALESAKDVNASPAHSSASRPSVSIQEEGSSCSCLSFDAASDSDSSSLASLCRDGEAEGKERRISGEERWVVRVIWLGIVVWTVALGFVLVWTMAEEGHGEYVTPT